MLYCYEAPLVIIHMIIGHEKERGNRMDETVDNGNKKKGFSKGLIAFIVAILVIGGGVGAYVMLNISTKEKYFLAEKKSFEFMTDKLEERYQPELDWNEQSKKKPTETAFTLSGEYNDPYGGGFGAMGPEQFINNSTLEIKTGVDMEKEQIAAKLKASVGDIEVDDINLYVNSNEIALGLPFVDELLQVKGDDIGKMLHEMDPEAFTGEEDINLENIFNGNNGLLTDEDMEYYKEAYIDMIYEELPEEAFESSDEKIKVNDTSVKTEKISLQLSEEELKGIITKVLDKMEKDEKLKDLIKEQIAIRGGIDNDEIQELLTDFETGIADAKEELKDFKIPDGLTSTIWVKDKLIVQRDFNLEIGPTEQDLVAFTIKGSQLLEDDSQVFDYDLSYTDEYDEGTINISGDLAWKDNKATDSIKLTAEDTVLGYEGSETLKDGKRDFKRTFSYEDPYDDGGSLIWEGNASYDKDKMNAEHNLSIESADLGQDVFALQVAVDGKTTKNVEMPKDANVKDLGSMSADDIMKYFEEDVAPNFQQWLMEKIGVGGLGL